MISRSLGAPKIINRVSSDFSPIQVKGFLRRHETQTEAMKTSGLLHTLVIAVALAPAVCAGQDSLPQTQFPTSQWTFADANTVEANTNTEGDDADSKGPLVEDRRDRIFYPGDTEHLNPLLRKLALNIVLDEKDIFTSPLHVNRHNALEWLVP